MVYLLVVHLCHQGSSWSATAPNQPYLGGSRRQEIKGWYVEAMCCDVLCVGNYQKWDAAAMCIWYIHILHVIKCRLLPPFQPMSLRVDEAKTGWWYTYPWKIWKSVGMMSFPIYGKSWKPCSKPPTRKNPSSTWGSWVVSPVHGSNNLHRASNKPRGRPTREGSGHWRGRMPPNICTIFSIYVHMHEYLQIWTFSYTNI